MTQCQVFSKHALASNVKLLGKQYKHRVVMRKLRQHEPLTHVIQHQMPSGLHLSIDCQQSGWTLSRHVPSITAL